MTHKTLSFHDLHLTTREVYLQMGYGDSLPDSRVAEEVADVMAMAEEVARPRFCFHVMNGTLHERPSQLEVGEQGVNMGDVIVENILGLGVNIIASKTIEK